MMLRRRFAVVAALAVPALVACGAGRDTETQHERATNLPSAHVGDLTVAAVRLVPSASAPAYIAPAPGNTAAPVASSAPTGHGTLAYLMMAVVNSGDSADSLTGVSLGSGTVRPVGVSAGGSGLTIPATQSVSFGDPDNGDTGAGLAVSGLPHPLELGTIVRVTLSFQNAGNVSLSVPVVDASRTGTTATASPPVTTGSYPSPSTTPSVLEP